MAALRIACITATVWLLALAIELLVLPAGLSFGATRNAAAGLALVIYGYVQEQSHARRQRSAPNTGAIKPTPTDPEPELAYFAATGLTAASLACAFLLQSALKLFAQHGSAGGTGLNLSATQSHTLLVAAALIAVATSIALTIVWSAGGGLRIWLLGAAALTGLSITPLASALRGGGVMLTALLCVLPLGIVLFHVLRHRQQRLNDWLAAPERLTERLRLPALSEYAALLLALAAAATVTMLTPGWYLGLLLMPAAFAALGVVHLSFRAVYMDLALLVFAVAVASFGGGGRLIGALLAATFFFWLARFWAQQLDHGRPWTTTGRLIPSVRTGGVALTFYTGAAAVWDAQRAGILTTLAGMEGAISDGVATDSTLGAAGGFSWGQFWRCLLAALLIFQLARITIDRTQRGALPALAVAAGVLGAIIAGWSWPAASPALVLTLAGAAWLLHALTRKPAASAASASMATTSAAHGAEHSAQQLAGETAPPTTAPAHAPAPQSAELANALTIVWLPIAVLTLLPTCGSVIGGAAATALCVHVVLERCFATGAEVEA